MWTNVRAIIILLVVDASLSAFCEPTSASNVFGTSKASLPTRDRDAVQSLRTRSEDIEGNEERHSMPVIGVPVIPHMPVMYHAPMMPYGPIRPAQEYWTGISHQDPSLWERIMQFLEKSVAGPIESLRKLGRYIIHLPRQAFR